MPDSNNNVFTFDELSLLFRLAGERVSVLTDEINQNILGMNEEDYENKKKERHRLRLLKPKIEKMINDITPIDKNDDVCDDAS